MTDTIIVRTIDSEADRQRLREFIAALQGARGLRAYEAHLARARYRTEFTIVLERDQALLGCVLLRHARWRLGRATLDVGVIERLLLSVDDRDGVLFEALIGVVLQTCADQDMTLIAATQPPELFCPLGFAPYTFYDELRLPAVQPPHSDQRVSYALRPLNERLDGPGDLEPLHAASYHDLALSELRVRPDWRSWLEANQNAYILEDRREATVGYAVFNTDTSAKPIVTELAVADAGIAHGMATMLAEFAATRGMDNITVRVPARHAFVRVALAHGAELQARAYSADGSQPVPLAGIIAVSPLLVQLQGELEHRLTQSRYAGWSGTLRFEIDGQATSLVFEQGHSSVASDAGRAADVVVRVVHLAALAQLLLGHRNAADLRSTDGLQCDPTAFGLLDALFGMR